LLLGGAGGKGVWGKLGEESDLDAAIDMKDPNYDSDLLDDDNIVLREITPESSDEDLKVIIINYTYLTCNYIVCKLCLQFNILI